MSHMFMLQQSVMEGNGGLLGTTGPHAPLPVPTPFSHLTWPLPVCEFGVSAHFPSPSFCYCRGKQVRWWVNQDLEGWS